MSKDAAWELAFWIITALAGVWLMALTTNVIANDRLRASEDDKLREKIECLLKENNVAHTLILSELKVLMSNMERCK